MPDSKIRGRDATLFASVPTNEPIFMLRGEKMEMLQPFHILISVLPCGRGRGTLGKMVFACLCDWVVNVAHSLIRNCAQGSIATCRFAAVFLAAAGSAVAADSLTVDFPITSPTKLPDRMMVAPRQVAAPDGAGYAEFFLLPILTSEELFVTVVFKEDGAQGPGLFWANEGAGAQTTISENLGENVVGYNQRTLHIPKNLSEQAGRLILNGDQTKIRRVRFDWVPPGQTFAAADQKPASLILADRLLQEGDLTGSQALSPPDTWFGKVLDASLQEEATALEGNLEFVVSLGQGAGQALLTARFLGLPFDSAPVAWVNGTRVGALQTAIPPLTDAGYLADESGTISYAGWRGASVMIPPALLKEGENSILIETSNSGVYLRDTSLQLRAKAAPSQSPVNPAQEDIISSIP